MIKSLLFLPAACVLARNVVNIDQRMTNPSMMTSESGRDLIKRNKKKISNGSTNSTNSNSGIDLRICYYNLLSSSNYDGTLSQTDYLTFLSLQSNDIALRTPWNTPVSSFQQLSPTFIKVYNLYACGDALVGCPSIEGISVEDVYDLEEGFLGRFCESVEGAVKDYAEEIGLLNGDISGVNDSSDDDIDEKTGETKKPASSENETKSNNLFTGILPISFTYQIGNTFDLHANSILTGSNPFNKMKDDLIEGVEEVVRNVTENLFDGNRTVVYVEGSFAIDSMSDVECAVQTANHVVCQYVLSTLHLMLVNQSKTEIELSFLDGLTEALHEDKPFFRIESGLIFVNVGNAGFKPVDVEEVNGYASGDVSQGNVQWKIPLLASASIMAVIGSILFAFLRRSHGKDENKQLEKQSMSEGDVFIGQLMENDSFTFKLTNSRSAGDNTIQDLERGTASTSSSAPSNSFSDVSNTSSARSCASSSSPGYSSSSSDETFASMVKNTNTNPFSLHSNASSSCGSSSPVGNLTPGKSPGLAFGQSPGGDIYNIGSFDQCESQDTLDQYVKTRLSLDNYDDWLSTVAESEDEFSRSDVSSLMWNDQSEKNYTVPLTAATNSSDNSKAKASTLKCGNSHDSLESLGDNIPTALATVSASQSGMEFVGDSSVASSKMTDDDGVSSIEVSTINSENTFLDGPRALLANIGVAFNTMKSTRNISKPRPFFEFASPKEDDKEGQSDISRHLDSDSLEEIKSDLASAIQAGDWTAVSATALLLAKADPATGDLEDMQASVASQRSLSTMTMTQQSRASELNNLVEKGDWRGILVAVSQYEGASDTESYTSNISALHEQPGTYLARDQLTSTCNSNIFNIKAEVEALVLSIVPDEIDNVDEMLLQFSGREDELIESLRIMQDRSIAQNERDANRN
eukprot:CCRYP_013719-RB/>CCRYP_013719-RB protein AED:0.11 eAED:0.11 QI:361/0.85/0.87/1/0.85/0.87/8/538/917